MLTQVSHSSDFPRDLLSSILGKIRLYEMKPLRKIDWDMAYIPETTEEINNEVDGSLSRLW